MSIREVQSAAWRTFTCTPNVGEGKAELFEESSPTA